MGSNRDSNTAAGITTTPAHIEDLIMQRLPTEVSHWLRYDAPCSYDVADLYRAMRDGMDSKTMLERLKADARVKTYRTYDNLHPQLPTAMAERHLGIDHYRAELAKAA